MTAKPVILNRYCPHVLGLIICTCIETGITRQVSGDTDANCDDDIFNFTGPNVLKLYLADVLSSFSDISVFLICVSIIRFSCDCIFKLTFTVISYA